MSPTNNSVYIYKLIHYIQTIKQTANIHVFQGLHVFRQGPNMCMLSLMAILK